MIDGPDKSLRKVFLHDVFSAVPPRYDLLNHILTGGLDKQWRRQAAEECLSIQPERVLDLCCGTSDLAINLARLVTGKVELTAVDFSRPMLDMARVKAARLPQGREIFFIQGDAASLPFADGYFDCIGTSFGFRNLAYRNPLLRQYMTEVFRVLRPGGRWVIIETSQPRAKLVRTIYHLYLRWVVPWLGNLLSGEKEAYRYLGESASHFYDFWEIRDMLMAVGFRRVSFRPLFLGVAGIHVAVK